MRYGRLNFPISPASNVLVGKCLTLDSNDIILGRDQYHVKRQDDMCSGLSETDGRHMTPFALLRACCVMRCHDSIDGLGISIYVI